MNIRYIRNDDEEEIENGIISFWGGRIKYNFEITYDDKKENVKLFEEELKLNLENQFDLENIHKELI